MRLAQNIAERVARFMLTTFICWLFCCSHFLWNNFAHFPISIYTLFMSGNPPDFSFSVIYAKPWTRARQAQINSHEDLQSTYHKIISQLIAAAAAMSRNQIREITRWDDCSVMNDHDAESERWYLTAREMSSSSVPHHAPIVWFAATGRSRGISIYLLSTNLSRKCSNLLLTPAQY
jgi:hypothetical protein